MPYGDWPKNLDTVCQKVPKDAVLPAGTFEHDATMGELQVLVAAYRFTGDKRYRDAFLRGFRHRLNAQYANAGWTQYYPLGQAFHRHITFNGGAMVRVPVDHGQRFRPGDAGERTGRPNGANFGAARGRRWRKRAANAAWELRNFLRKRDLAPWCNVPRRWRQFLQRRARDSNPLGFPKEIVR